jgi:hypothetical protein
VQAVDQALAPVGGLRGIEDLLSIQVDAPDDRRARRITGRLGDRDRGAEEEGENEGEAAGQK